MSSLPLAKIILGTRGSELALAQASMVQTALEDAWPGLVVEREIIKTTGDLRPDLKLSEFNRGPQPVDKGIFTKELEAALQAGRVHAAVHSLKDVPTELEEGFCLPAVLPRAPVEDVLVTKTPALLSFLPAGSLVATSSVRRSRQLTALRPDLRVEDIRGNVTTRLRKLAESDSLAGIILARAGLQRLGLFAERLEFEGHVLHQHLLASQDFLPAASQGAVALEVFHAPPQLLDLLAAINHPATFTQICAERHFLHLLKAGCQTPVGLLSEIHGDTLTLTTAVFSESSSAAAPRRAKITAPASNPKAAAARLFAALS